MRHLLIASLALCGCGDLLNADAYRLRQPVPNPCAALEVPAGDDCVAVGVTDCGEGFEPDAEGGCEALAASSPCPIDSEGQLRFSYPGNPQCTPVGKELSCPPDPDPTTYLDNFLDGTRFVWAGSAASTEDGSREAPHKTLAGALAAADEGEIIVVASGEYRESVVIDKPLTVRGACNRDVVVVGQDGPAITVDTNRNTPVELMTLGIRGSSVGVLVEHSVAHIINSSIVDTDGVGVLAHGGKVLVSRVLIDRPLGNGVEAWGSELTIRESNIRDVRSDVPRLRFGRGVSIHAARYGGDPERGVLTLERSLIEGAGDAGVAVEGADALVRDSLIRDMRRDADAAALGFGAGAFGVSVAFEPARHLSASARVEGSVVDGAWGAGLRAFGASLEVSGSVVRGTRAPAPPCRAHALRAVGNAGTPAEVVVRDSLLADGRGSGVHVLGADVILTRSIVRGTDVEPCGGRMGDGVAVHALPDAAARTPEGARAVVQQSLLEGHARAAALAVGGSVMLDGTLIRDSAFEIWNSSYAAADSLVPVDSIIHEQRTTRCERNGNLEACSVTAGLAEPDLFPRGDDGERLPLVGVGSAIEAPINNLPIVGAVAWLLRRDEVPPSVTDPYGLWEIRSVPANTQFVFMSAAPGYQGRALSVHTRGSSLSPAADFLFPVPVLEEFEVVYGTDMDFSAALVHVRRLNGLAVRTDPPSPVPTAYIVDDFPTLEPDPNAEDAVIANIAASTATVHFESLSGAPMSCPFDLPALSHGLPTTDGTMVIPAMAGMTNTVSLFGPCVPVQ